MERINYNSLRFLKFFDNLNPKNSGIRLASVWHEYKKLSGTLQDYLRQDYDTAHGGSSADGHCAGLVTAFASASLI